MKQNLFLTLLVPVAFLGICVTTASSSPLYLSQTRNCPAGYSLAPIGDRGLNGDLNQRAGGKDIFLCLALDDNPLYGLGLQQTPRCNPNRGWKPVPKSSGLNGDLNQRAGGKDIFLCYSSNPRYGTRIKTITLKRRKPSSKSSPIIAQGLNGDLNQRAGGRDIFLELTREVVAPPGDGGGGGGGGDGHGHDCNPCLFDNGK